MLKAKKAAQQSSSYLTKRRLVSAARTGARKAAQETMRIMGYTIIAHKGWVVKKYKDGHIEKISPLEAAKTNGTPALD